MPPDTRQQPEDAVGIVPLGGLGEIGLNMMMIESGGRSLLVDAGRMIPEEHMLGVDSVIPLLSYVLENRGGLLGVVLTHGHEDHIGALPYVLSGLNVPVYGTRFSLELVREKLRDNRVPGPWDLRLMDPGKTFDIGPFRIDPIPVAHTIADGVGLAIGTPLGTIIHSGDFKIDDARCSGPAAAWDRFAHYGERGVLLLMSDSTNIEKEGYSLSEDRVTESIRVLLEKAPGRVIIAMFASNVCRIQHVVNLCAAFGRKVAFTGKSMLANTRIAKEIGYLNIPRGVEITPADLDRHPERKVALITTGSQGEPLAALTLMALERYGRVRIQPGDTVIFSSRFIPGHERAITDVINMLYKLGADVIYEPEREVHASGHAYREEQRRMIRVTRPSYFIPVHGEYRHLVRHARLAMEEGLPEDRALILENGDRLELDREGARVTGRVEVGRVFVDGTGVGTIGYPVLRDRRNLSRDGMVMAVVAVDNRTGDLLSDPEIMTCGFMLEEHENRFLDSAKGIILDTIREYRRENVVDWTEFKLDVTRQMRRFFNKALKRRPVVSCTVMAM